LRQQVVQPAEIILVLEPDRELASFYNTRLLEGISIIISEEMGLSNARNSGVRHAKGEVVAFIDDDAVADKNWLGNMVKNYDEDDVVGTGGPVEPVWETNRPAWFPAALDWVVGCTFDVSPHEKSSVRNPIGCNMSFRKSVFDVAGYFATTLGRRSTIMIGSEEAEFCVRLSRALPKTRVVYDPTARVFHWVPRSRAKAGYLIKRSFYEGYSKAMMTKAQSKSDVLIPEKNYLGHLFVELFPSYLKSIYKLDRLAKLAAIWVSLLSVLTGYVCFRVGSLFSKSKFEKL